jgi:hypothetical protein
MSSGCDHVRYTIHLVLIQSNLALALHTHILVVSRYSKGTYTNSVALGTYDVYWTLK